MGRRAAAPGTARTVPGLWGFGSTPAVPMMETARGVRPHGGPHWRPPTTFVVLILHEVEVLPALPASRLRWGGDQEEEEEGEDDDDEKVEFNEQIEREGL